VRLHGWVLVFMGGGGCGGGGWDEGRGAAACVDIVYGWGFGGWGSEFVTQSVLVWVGF